MKIGHAKECEENAKSVTKRVRGRVVGWGEKIAISFDGLLRLDARELRNDGNVERIHRSLTQQPTFCVRLFMGF